MRKLLFLDVDGVLHARNSGRLDKVPLIQALLADNPDLSLVISSNWRASWELEDLATELFGGYAERVEGATPLVADSCFVHYGERGQEIMAYLENRGGVPFLAVDDSAALFSEYFLPYLLLTKREEGLTPIHIEEIKRRLDLQ